MHMVWSDFAGDDFYIDFSADLADEITDPSAYLSVEDTFAILWDEDEMDFEIVLRVCCGTVVSHRGWVVGVEALW